MERTFRKPIEDMYPHKIFENQLITVDDLLQFKKTIGRRTPNGPKISVKYDP